MPAQRRGSVLWSQADSLRWAHEANPQARLLVNEYDLFADADASERFLRLLEMLLEKRIPLHAVGIQAHDRMAFSSRTVAGVRDLWHATGAACLLHQTDLPLLSRNGDTGQLSRTGRSA
ncbi:MAG: endo-1,4-beta-xylanase [Armatimonadota bacterium]